MLYFKQLNCTRFKQAILLVILILIGFENTGHSNDPSCLFPNVNTPTSSKISVSSDDAEEDTSNGSVDINSSDLEMINDGVDQIVGLRFSNLNIPQCAPINSAYIQFVAKVSGPNPNIDPCNLTIYGEAVDDAPTFTTDDFNISGRQKTTSSVIWSPPQWLNDGENYQTIDISPVIQEIVEREGFSQNSAIAIIIEGEGMRRAFSVDENILYGPEIFIDYNPNIPDGDGDGTCDANDLCNGPEPGTPCDDGDSGTYNDIIQSNCVCMGTPYDCPGIQANLGDSCDDGNPETMNDMIIVGCICDGEYECENLQLNIGDPCDDMNPETSNDIVTDSCECVGEYDCENLQLNIGDPCDDGISGTYDDTVNSNCECEGIWECPTLMAGFGDPCDDGDPNTSSDMVDSTCNCVGLPFVCVQIDSGSDDAEESATGDVDPSSSDLEIVEDNSDVQTIGLRFQNITIPQCGVIETASIQFTSDNSDNVNPCNLTIYGEAIDDASTFDGGEDFNISNRVKTDASVQWSPVDWSSDETGPAQQTVDISSIVQEIVNRVGFQSGNSIAIIIEGEGMRRAYSFDGESSNAAQLCIEYTPDGPDSDGDGTCDANDLCPGGLEPGSPCDDGDPETPNDFIDSTCVCVGGFDCPDLMIDFGDPCDDGFSGTYNDSIDMDCNCVGVWECEDLMLGYGDPCDDLDATTLYDAVDSMCNCIGIPFIEISVAGMDDDAEESPSGDMDLDSDDLEMVFDDSIQTVGIRFTNHNIPPCAVINRAYIQFTAKTSGNENPCNLQIFGEANDHAFPFSTDDFNISIRTKTSTIVTWSPEEWGSNDSGPEQQTPDLTTVLQEVINRPGFTDTSAIAFIIEGVGRRRAYSYDAGDTLAPRLYVEFLAEVPDEDGDGVCDTNDLCPGGLEPGTPCNDSLDTTYDDVIDDYCDCVGIEYDCPNIFANIGDDCDDGDINTPNDFIDSTCVCVGGFDCPDLMLDFGDECDDGIPGTHSDMIDSTCTCVGIWDCEDLMTGIGYPCDDGDPSTLDDTIDENCDCIGSPTVYSQIAASSDDAEEEEGTNNISLTSSDLELVNDDGVNQTVGLRFVDLNIPKGARIDTAFIQFTTDEILDPNACNLQIYGQAADDPQTFLETDGDITARPKTNAMVSWSPEEWIEEDEAGLLQQTPNLKSIVKELVNRDGFNETSAMAFIIEGSGTRTATSFDGKPENAPELYVRYDLPLNNSEPTDFEGFNNIKVFPVPTTSDLNISFKSNKEENTPMRILDLNGRVLKEEFLFTKKGENHYQFKNLQLETGIYFIQILINGQLQTEKFIMLK